MNAAPPPGPDETLDPILGGRLRIYQPKRAGRFSLDALLLAHFVRLAPGEDLIDLGTGTGVIALVLAARGRAGRILGIDIQPGLVALAERSAALNGCAGRVAFRRGDVRSPEAFSAPRAFDVAVFNPPYRRLSSGRLNPDPERALARHEIAGAAADFLAAAAWLLREGGRAAAIYPAARMVELICRMRAARIEPKRLRMVHSRPGGTAAFVLLEGRKGGGEELAVEPPLFIYGPGGGYSGEAADLFNGLSAFPAPAGD
jgi:tRNA1Val (adenine37-N6)-methyltransferase